MVVQNFPSSFSLKTAAFRIEQQNYEFPEQDMDQEVCVVLDSVITPSEEVIINLASENNPGAGK